MSEPSLPDPPTAPPRYVCVHGHFYQPPRENPWLEAIEQQDTAAPYHDWNERIAAECYAPNARCRMLDGHGRIVRLVNNYSRMSFNFGPTLLSWLEEKDPATYAAILEADRLGRARFGGHGPAIAQVYNHVIMPLANRRDKLTQIRWGIADFQHRFGREPEGMWLAETAVDLETLDLLAGEGIRFTILSPYQARRARPIGGTWADATAGRIDPTRAYTVALPSGGSIAVFFYNGPISQAIAFEGLLRSGEKLAARLLDGLSVSRTGPQLAHVATDGETYGHHHTHGDMALACALEIIDARPDVELTVYGEFLERHPPEHEAEILENTAWSCSHGVGRWNADCGCRANSNGWNQAWRSPLRAALDWLRDELAPSYEAAAGELFADPWTARDQYVRVRLDPSRLSDFWSVHATRPLTPDEATRALRLLELQRNCLLMYTSCGWFFDELSGIETVQVMAYAGRAAQLAEELFGRTITAEFLNRLAEARGNLPHLSDGRLIFERFVRPQRVDLAKVAAHFAVSSLFEDYGPVTRVFGFEVTAEEVESPPAIAKSARLVLGRVNVVHRVTRASADFEYAAVHLGDLNLRGGVCRPEFNGCRDAVRTAFLQNDFAELLHRLDRDYAAAEYSLKAVFRDEQRKILGQMLEATSASMEAVYRQLYVSQSPTMLFLTGLDTPLLPAFRHAAEFVLNLDLKRAIAAAVPDLSEIRRLFDEAQLWEVRLDAVGLGHAVCKAIARMVADLRADPSDVDLMQRSVGLLEMAEQLKLPVDYWRAQNDYWKLLEGLLPLQRERSISDKSAAEWVTGFTALGRQLRIAVPGSL